MDNTPIGLLNACIQFFGLKPGQSRMEFMKQEYKPLTPEDRAELRDALIKQGYNIVEAAQPA